MIMRHSGDSSYERGRWESEGLEAIGQRGTVGYSRGRRAKHCRKVRYSSDKLRVELRLGGRKQW